jgi:PAS domain S-box-containing protein
MLLEKVKDAILLRDLDHHILYWNQSAERLYGWSAAEALGRSVRDLLYANPEAFDAATTHVLQHGEWTGELPQNRRDGSVITVDANWTLMRDDDGQPKSILAINTDITERKKLEAQFIRSQRLESIGTLAGGIAHDLNNLLAPIVMGAGLMRQLNPPDNTKKILQTIEDSAKRGATLIKQVLSFARGVEGERVTIDLAELGTEIENIIVNTFPRNIIFKSELPTDLWPVVGDPTQLHQVVINLSVHARDAMPGGGRLSLTARNAEIDEQFAAMDRDVHPGRYVVLEVKDDGTGMPPEVIDRIFDPFYTTKDLGQGTGLGLSTLLGIVRSHGGFVNVSSQVGRGSAFQVHLPVRPPPATEAPPKEAAPTSSHGRGELILVVDDERSILEVTQQTLEAFGYRVLTAEDGTQAIGTFAQHRDEVALVITDMMMPVMDGPALITALRRLKPAVRIIAATGLNIKANVGRAGKIGVSHFLPKPFTAEILLDMVRRALDAKDSQTPF